MRSRRPMVSELMLEPQLQVAGLVADEMRRLLLSGQDPGEGEGPVRGHPGGLLAAHGVPPLREMSRARRTHRSEARGWPWGWVRGRRRSRGARGAGRTCAADDGARATDGGGATRRPLTLFRLTANGGGGEGARRAAAQLFRNGWLSVGWVWMLLFRWRRRDVRWLRKRGNFVIDFFLLIRGLVFWFSFSISMWNLYDFSICYIEEFQLFGRRFATQTEDAKGGRSTFGIRTCWNILIFPQCLHV